MERQPLLRRLALVACAGLVSAALAAAPADAAQDETSPYVTWTISVLSTRGWMLTSAWGSADADSGVNHSVARWRVKKIGGTWSAWHRPDKWRHLPPSAEVSKHLRQGWRCQIQVRVVDNAGNRSAWRQVGGGTRVHR